MGTDKTLLKYGKFSTLTHFSFDRLGRIFTDVKIAAKSQKFSPPLPIIKDEFDDFCPLGVIASLDEIYKEPVFIMPADTPFIEFDTIKRLFESLGNSQICVAKNGERIHYLCGFFDPSCAKIARKLLENGEKKVQTLIKSAQSKLVEFSQPEQFLNLNYPKDLEKIYEKAFIY